MILKPWSPGNDLERLEALRQRHPRHAKAIDEEIRKRRSGEKGERDAARYIDEGLGALANTVVIHDLRIVTAGGVAQFDHLVLNRVDHFLVLETKRFASGIKITEEGEFLRWDDWAKRYKAMESPRMRCDRHERALLAHVEAEELMPRRLGFRVRPRIRSLVLVNPTAKVLRPQGYDTGRVVKADQVMEHVFREHGTQGILGAALDASKVLSREAVHEIAEALVRRHVPAEHDYEGMLGIKVGDAVQAYRASRQPPQQATSPSLSETATSRPETVSAGQALACKSCSSDRGEIRHGKFGYYWKCLACDGNTKLVLPGAGKIKKDGPTFTYVDPLGAEVPYHVNGSA